jgi:hypothetical protein
MRIGDTAPPFTRIKNYETNLPSRDRRDRFLRFESALQNIGEASFQVAEEQAA